MREILYRGKRLDIGEWEEGSLVKTVDSLYGTEIYSIVHQTITSTGMLTPFHTWYAVDPDTVGQYTGLTDKNGKRIFEGDILKGDEYPFTDNDGSNNYYLEVVWFENCPAFGLYTFKHPLSYVRGAFTGNTSYMKDFDSSVWEVIGNVHDNPEMITEVQDVPQD